MSDDNAKLSQSPLGNLRKKHHMLTPRQSERNLGISDPSLGGTKSRKATRFQIGGIGNVLFFLFFKIISSTVGI